MLYSYFVALNIVSEQHLFKLQTNNITFNWDILFYNFVILYMMMIFFSTYPRDVCTLFFVVILLMP